MGLVNVGQKLKNMTLNRMYFEEEFTIVHIYMKTFIPLLFKGKLGFRKAKNLSKISS